MSTIQFHFILATLWHPGGLDGWLLICVVCSLPKDFGYGLTAACCQISGHTTRRSTHLAVHARPNLPGMTRF